MDDNSTHTLAFAALALRMGFLTPEALAKAVQAWAERRDRSLGQVLEELGLFTPDRRRLLEGLADSKRGTTPQEPPTVPETQAPAGGVPTSAGMRFRILRPHARGGLGQISVAFDEELRREVALKEIQERHADDPNSRARFLLEAEVTGGLEHPGIVPVYGLGQHLDGRPFYAMRFIRGHSLQNALAVLHAGGKPAFATPAGRVELRQFVTRLIEACNAIAYAHARGIVHRDLKPANVMLGPFGETLIVDWGLARTFDLSAHGAVRAAEGQTSAPLQPPSLSALEPTRPGAAVGTPGYMAPEQAAGLRDAIGPAADVYSLGALLYYTLTGQPPFPGKNVGLLLQRTVRGDFPLPRQIDASIPPDLEAVCLKAMALEPKGRHASARDLADELGRWLSREAPSAVPSPRPRRRWLVMGLSTAAVALLLVGTLALRLGIALSAERDDNRTWRVEAERAGDEAHLQRRRAEEQQRRAEAQRRRAEEEERRLRRLTGYLAGLFTIRSNVPAGFGPVVWEGPLPFDGLLLRAGKSKGERLTAHAVLRRCAAEVTSFADDPVLFALVRAALGSGCRQLGLYREAQTLLAPALDVRHYRPPDHPDVAFVSLCLAWLHHDRGETTEAARLCREALRAGRGLPAGHPLLRQARLLLAWCAVQQGDVGKVERLLASPRPAGTGTEEAEATAVRLALAARLLREGKLAPAARQGWRVLGILWPPAGPWRLGLPDRRLDALNTLGLYYLGVGQRTAAPADLAAAERLQRQVLGNARRLLPERHPLLALPHRELAFVLDRQGKSGEAAEEYRAFLELLRDGVGLDDPRMTPAVEEYARFLARQGRYADGKALLAEAYEALSERFNFRTPPVRDITARLVRFAEDNDDYAEAARRATFLNPGQGEDGGRGRLEGKRLEVLGLLWAGRFKEAEATLKQERERLPFVEPARGRSQALCDLLLAEVCAATGRVKEAKTLGLSAGKHFRADKDVPPVWFLQALLLQHRLQPDPTGALTDEAVACARRLPDRPLLLAKALEAQAAFRAERGEAAKAVPLLEEASALVGRERGEAAAAAALVRARLWQTLLKADRAGEVLRRLEEHARRPGWKAAAPEELVRALALHRLGRKGEARAALLRATVTLAALKMPGPWSWEEGLRLRQLQREVERRLARD